MNVRENTLAILNYESFDKMPVVAFGYWSETIKKWADEGHITKDEEAAFEKMGGYNSDADMAILKKLGFDYNWGYCIGANPGLDPSFDFEVLETFPDGSRIISDYIGMICKDNPGVVSIPSDIGTKLTGRQAWEELYLPKLKMKSSRLNMDHFKAYENVKPENRPFPIGISLGSLIGVMRSMLGVEHFCYLYADDEELYVEIIDTLCGLCYECAQLTLSTGFKFDYGHFWEDICYKNGPLVTPHVFDELVGPWYKKITGLCREYDVNIISLDCDGLIDSLIPTWINNGANTMFPIEVGTWNASVKPWREKYGKELRGIGGMDKRVFSRDKKAVDDEIDRLKSLISLGGYIPCPDHLIAPDAKFELVQYYCDKMQSLKV